MLGRRLLVLVAVLMGLTALAASLAPPPPPQRGATATPTPSATRPPAATSAPTPGATVSAHISATRAGAPREVTAARGDLVDLVVTGDVIDAVSISGLAVLEPLDPSSPAYVELYADTPGSYAIRLLGAHRRIGTLRITD